MSSENSQFIDISSPKKEFEAHLNLPGNHRIFFSGPFGIGKTYFLKDFFEKSKDFVSIHLYPVNYSVAQNEDIFELIKYDLLHSLISNFHLFQSKKVDNGIKMDAYLKRKLPGVISGFLSKLELLEKETLEEKLISGFVKLTIPVINSYRKFSTETDAAFDELEIVDEFRKEIEEQMGSIYENNLVTKLIYECVDRLKNEGKKVVLIIDDLDRIDPEHIFRILNIFSAHFDLQDETTNKFGFDRVVVVGDYGNIKSIFDHRYGVKADFNGYLDKFYSEKIFSYNNEKAIAKFLGDLNFFDSDVPSIMSYQIERECVYVVSKTLTLLLDSRMLNLRKLLKYNQGAYEYSFPDYLNYRYSITYVMVFLDYVLGGRDGCLSHLERLPDSIPFQEDKSKELLERFFLPVLASPKKQILKLEDYVFEYDSESDGYNKIYHLKKIARNTSDVFPGTIPFGSLMRDSAMAYYKRNLRSQFLR